MLKLVLCGQCFGQSCCVSRHRYATFFLFFFFFFFVFCAHSRLRIVSAQHVARLFVRGVFFGLLDGVK